MDELELPDGDTPLWGFRVGVDFLVSARDMAEARALVDRALAAEDSDGTPFLTRDHRIIDGELPWGVSGWEAVPPRPSQAALVQEKYPGLVADVAVVEGLGALLRSETMTSRLSEQTLQRIRQALAEVDPEVEVVEPDFASARRVFEGVASDAAAYLAEGVYKAFDATDREYAVVVAPSELTPSGRVSAAFPKERHEARTLDEISVLLQQHTRDQSLPDLVRLISRRVNTTHRQGLPSWVPLEGEPAHREAPATMNVGVIVWSDLDPAEPTVLAHPNSVTLACQVATTLYETMVDDDGFAGATEFLSSHSTPAEWRSPEDVHRWLDALSEATPLPWFSIQLIPVSGTTPELGGPVSIGGPVPEHVTATASEPAPVGWDTLWSYRVPVEFDVSARTQDEARRLVDEALEGDAPGGIAVVQQRQRVLSNGDVFGVLGWHHPPHLSSAPADPVQTVLVERAAELSDDSPTGPPAGPATGTRTSRPGWNATGRS